MSKSIPFPAIDGRVMRATVLDGCGRPNYGDAVKLVSDGFVSVQVTPNYNDGNEVAVPNARGRNLVYRPARATLTNLGVAIVFGLVDPALFTTFTGAPPQYDPTGRLIGFDIDDDIAPLDVAVALEVWTDATDGLTACGDGEDEPYGYFLLPFLSGGKISDYTIENGAVSFGITDAFTRRNSPWGEGPYNVELDGTGQPIPLSNPIRPATHQRVIRTLLAPPEADFYGLTPLDDPTAPAANGATAGTPGTFDPTPSTRPYDLDDLAVDVTPTPTTAWQVGQYVVLGDGSEANWNGSTWLAGRAG